MDRASVFLRYYSVGMLHSLVAFTQARFCSENSPSSGLHAESARVLLGLDGLTSATHYGCLLSPQEGDDPEQRNRLPRRIDRLGLGAKPLRLPRREATEVRLRPDRPVLLAHAPGLLYRAGKTPDRVTSRDVSPWPKRWLSEGRGRSSPSAPASLSP